MLYKQILCPVDFSPASELAIARAAALTGHADAVLTVLHVIEHFPEDLPVGCGAREDEDPQQYLLDAAERRLASLMERLGLPGARRQVVVSRRSARHEIVECARQINADLVVVGTATRGLLSHLGSTSSALVHALPCDLLVAKEA
jgi:universal stress protein A